MPLTFIDIERQKNWRIGVLFLVLLAVYFCIAALFGTVFLHVSPAPRFLAASGLTALLLAAIHIWFSAYDTVGTVVRTLNAAPPDPGDEVHRRLIDIVEEIHVVTGNRRPFRSAVVPSLSLNALAVADLRGQAVIGITEGLLSRLSRPQLETVIAHEAHHILSGDCLETTVAASLFGAYAGVIEKLNQASRARFSPGLFLAGMLLRLSYLINMFISREREYRADAAAVRMTRNPLALAETLHLLSRSWRGAGFIGSGFEMLCIVNPQAMALDESEGFWADLLSTHPPLMKRIDILLKMARVSIRELETKAEEKSKRTALPDAVPHYYVMSPQQQWQGPFNIAELSGLLWLSPLSWISSRDGQKVDRAWKDPAINQIFAARIADREKSVSALSCPVCTQRLVVSTYEGTSIAECRFCGGSLVENSKIARIIARTGRGQTCSDRINSLARTVVNGNQARLINRPAPGSAGTPHRRSCPKCRNEMSRGFYSPAYLVEIDRCSFCEMTWFDQDELQMLQCLIQNRIEPSPVRAVAPQAI